MNWVAPVPPKLEATVLDLTLFSLADKSSIRQIIVQFTRSITSLVQLLGPSSLPCVGSSSKGNTLSEFVNLVPGSRGGVEGFCRRF